MVEFIQLEQVTVHIYSADLYCYITGHYGHLPWSFFHRFDVHQLKDLLL